MNFTEFKEAVIDQLRMNLGEQTKVHVEDILKYGGKTYTGLSIITSDGAGVAKPIFNLEEYYQRHLHDNMLVSDSVNEILEIMKQHQQMGAIEKFAERLKNWEDVRENVYPVLIPQKGNETLLKSLVKSELLDLAVIYIIRETMDGKESVTVKINHSLFAHYGILKDELHETALENQKKEGYGFFDLKDVAMNMFMGDGIEKCTPVSKMESDNVYMFRNKDALYGAAGILNKELLKEKIGKGRNCYIIPSSTHELLFIPIGVGMSVEEINEMIRNVNETVDVQERLSDHCYYYHGASQEIRMCA